MGDERKSGRFAVLGAVCLLAFITYVQRIGFVAISPTIREQFQFNSRQMGLLLAAFQLAYGLCEVPGGRLGDRLGVRYLLAVLAVNMSVVTAVTALAFGLPAVAALAFLVFIRAAFAPARRAFFLRSRGPWPTGCR